MTPELLENLRTSTSSVRERWEALLRIERVNSPLANPDALVHLIPDSLASILASLSKKGRTRVSFSDAIADRLPACNCGNNPYLAYFTAGEQALVETVVLLQAAEPSNGHSESDVASVIRAVRALARNDIDTFCGVCRHRGTAKGCRFAPANACAENCCG